ncbi:MAG: hypothetical protein AAB383_00865 [Patescibacteria group bacterium]
MYNYTFTGLVHPERVSFSVSEDLPFQITHPGFKVNGISKLRFDKSKITLSFASEIDYSKNADCNLETLKNIFEENIRLVIDSYCYINSYSYDVEITKVVCKELHIDNTFGVRGEWNVNKTKDECTAEFTEILRLFDRPERMFLKDVFADFRRAIKYPSMTAGFCFRAVETIRKFYFEDQSISNDDKRRERGWKELGETLGFKEADFKEIKDFALPNRHGEHRQISYEQRERIMNFTRSIINKLIQIIKGTRPA